MRVQFAVVTLVALLGCESRVEPEASRPSPAAAAAPVELTGSATPDAPGAAEWNYPAIAWRSATYGLSKMRAERRPGLVVVMAAWCSACKGYRALFRDPEIIEAAKNFEMILIDGDATPDRAAEWNLDGGYFPRTFITTPEGAVEPRYTGPNPNYPHFFGAGQRDVLLAALRSAATQYRD